MNYVPNHDAHEMTEGDIEKRGEEVKCMESDISTTTPPFDSSSQHELPLPPVLGGHLAKWNAKVERLAGLEARGIRRVLPEEKQECGRRGYLHMFELWFGINLVVMSVITGLLGPLVYQLGWVDCVCIIIFANALSCSAVGFISTFGPQSGNRTMVGGARVGTQALTPVWGLSAVPWAFFSRLFNRDLKWSLTILCLFVWSQ